VWHRELRAYALLEGKTKMKKSIRVSAGLTVVVLAAFGGGCASVAVTDDAIVKNTAQALNLDQSAFTISNRVDDGMKTTYTAKTNAGKQFSCYVTGTVSVAGRSVSDAMCTEAGATAGAAATPGSCNALLKAAGKC
jgi:hypothetical protein